jgi:hypothetical protein
LCGLSQLTLCIALAEHEPGELPTTTHNAIERMRTAAISGEHSALGA